MSECNFARKDYFEVIRNNSPNIGRKYRATMSDYANEVRAN